MNFEVNGQTYFLGFSDVDGALALFTSTPSGLQELPIASDDGSIVALERVPAEKETPSLN